MAVGRRERRIKMVGGRRKKKKNKRKNRWRSRNLRMSGGEKGCR